MMDIELQEKIEAFLLEKMPPDERAAFEETMRTDAELARQVEDFRLVFQTTDRLAQLDLQQDFARWKTELAGAEATAPAVKKPVLTGFLIFAVVAGLTALVWLWSQKPASIIEFSEPKNLPNKELPPTTPPQTQPETDDQKPSPGQKPQAGSGKTQGVSEEKYLAFARQEFEVLMSEFATRGTSGGAKTGTRNPLSDAKTSLKKGDFAAALLFLEKIPAGDPDYFESLELRGRAFFFLKNYKAAAQNFEKCLAHEPQNDPVEYQLLLCFLAERPKTEGNWQRLLAKIKSDSGHSFREKAARLEERLGRE